MARAVWAFFFLRVYEPPQKERGNKEKEVGAEEDSMLCGQHGLGREASLDPLISCGGSSQEGKIGHRVKHREGDHNCMATFPLQKEELLLLLHLPHP